MEMPFEAPTLYLIEKWMENPEKSKEIKSLIDSLITLLVRYRQMLHSSKSCYEELKLNFNTQREITLSVKEYVYQQLCSEESRICYLSFLEELNRCGRVFKERLEIEISDCNRINFYRNKAIEHAETFNSSRSYTSHIKMGRITIATHFGAFNTNQRQECYDKLKEWFKKDSIDMPATVPNITDEEYSDFIYSNLEKIKGRWWTEKGINKNFVDCLFEFKFPIPIFDVEEYCMYLSNKIENKVKSVY